MPRKTTKNINEIEKNENILEDKVDVNVEKKVKKTPTKKNTTKSKSKIETDSINVDDAINKEEPEKITKTKATKTTKKTTTKSKSTTKKTATSTTKKTSSKKTSSKTTSTTKKRVSKKDTKVNESETSIINEDEITSSTNLTNKIDIIEYYDLPYKYNQTIVKVLAQTPKTLFIYWDISENDRTNFINQYGENFFNETKPVLIIHNITMNYSFEIDVDDFANSWYLHVNDSNCEYLVELGRRKKYYANHENSIEIPNNYLYITSSNKMDAPNDHILFDKNNRTVYFKDVKTNIVTQKEITSISLLRNLGKIYNLYDLQKDFNEEMLRLDLSNFSSSNSSPVFK